MITERILKVTKRRVATKAIHCRGAIFKLGHARRPGPAGRLVGGHQHLPQVWAALWASTWRPKGLSIYLITVLISQS